MVREMVRDGFLGRPCTVVTGVVGEERGHPAPDILDDSADLKLDSTC